MDEEEVSPGTGTAIASKDALLERRDSTGRDPQSPQSGGFDLDPQGELDYEELLGSGEEPHLGKDPLESSVNPLESGKDPLENGEPPVHQVSPHVRVVACNHTSTPLVSLVRARKESRWTNMKSKFMLWKTSRKER